MSATLAMIETSYLSHTYRRDGTDSTPALREVTLALQPGEYVTVVGANGSGKTTLARHLNALLQPTAGHVRVAGLDTRDRRLWPAIRSTVSMVFQRPEDQLIAATVEDDVAFGPENLNLAGAEIRARVRWALETVEMWERRDFPPHLLSAGQQQRVAIAGGLAMKPQCLVLDEATAMLDPAGRRHVLELLQRLHAEGITIIAITHRMDELAGSQRTIALDGGRVAFDGPSHDLYASGDRVARLGLAAPPLVQLAQALTGAWDFVPAGLAGEEEMAAALVPHLSPEAGWRARDVDDSSQKRPPALLEIRDLGHTYLAGTPLAVVALAGVDLDLAAGEVVAVVGATGSGKSTLLQLAAGLLRPQVGQVRLIGPAQSDPTRRRVGILLQRPEEQLFETFVGDDVAFGPRQLSMDPAGVRERVRWAMDLAGLPFEAYKDRFCTAISGGEQRKAALAGALALQPEILLLDEPTAGLDPRSRSELLATLRRLQQERGTAIMVATHDLDLAAGWADRLMVLDKGRVAALASPRQILGRPDLCAAFDLEPPAVARLFWRLRDRGVDLPRDVMTVAEAANVLNESLARVGGR